MAEHIPAKNIAAAVASLFVPGLGQLLQRRSFAAAAHFVWAIALWPILLGWFVHLWSFIDAAQEPPLVQRD